MTAHTLQNALRDILAPACANPDAMQIRVVPEDRFFGVQVTPATPDMPRLIGNGGANFVAVKSILNDAASRDGKHIRYFVRDPEPDRVVRIRPAAVELDPEWNPRDAVKAMTSALELAHYSPSHRLLRQESGRWRIVVEKPISMQMGNGLARWLHVVARSQGGQVDFDFALA